MRKKKKNSWSIGKKEITLGGTLSCCFFILEVMVFFLCLGIAYAHNGEAGIGVGLGGFAVAVLGILGLLFGIDGRKQKGKFFHYIDEFGIGGNLIVLIAMIILFIIGMNGM